MLDRYHAVYFSPHLDDVAFSCGGRIHQQVERERAVLVVTVCAGDPPGDALSDYARSLHEEWALAAEAAAARRLEDARAWSRMGVDIAHWDTPDCIYRCDPDDGSAIYPTEHSIFGPVHSSESGLVDRIAARMRSLPPADDVFLPLGVGGHVDHALTRSAGERHFGLGCAYYEDYPYSEDRSLLAGLVIDGAERWISDTLRLTEADILARIAAMGEYESQLGLFYGREAMQAQVARHVAGLGGERVWRRECAGPRHGARTPTPPPA